jgi:hypothetical protein
MFVSVATGGGASGVGVPLVYASFGYRNALVAGLPFVARKEALGRGPVGSIVGRGR